MAESYEGVAAMEAIDDLVEAIERTIDATETDPAIIATALMVLVAKWAGQYVDGRNASNSANSLPN